MRTGAEQHATLLRRARAIADTAGDLAVCYARTALEQEMDEAAPATARARLERQVQTNCAKV